MQATVSGFVYLKFTRRTAPPLFFRALKVPHPLCYMSFSVPCLFFSFFFPGRRSDCPGGYAGLFQGINLAVGILHATYLLTCWSVSPKQVRSQCLVAQEPSWFLCIMWHGEAMCRLGVLSVGVLLLLGCFSCQVWLHVSVRLLLYRAHTICFFPLVTILDFSHMKFCSMWRCTV
jgi:hypothetical protein